MLSMLFVLRSRRQNNIWRSLRFVIVYETWKVAWTLIFEIAGEKHVLPCSPIISLVILRRSQLTCLKITLALPPAMTIRSPQSFMTAATGSIFATRPLISYDKLSSRLLSFLNSHASKVFWDTCFYAKMAADLFCLRVCLLFASFLVLTRGQNNRTVFSPSSTSGNSCLVVFGLVPWNGVWVFARSVVRAFVQYLWPLHQNDIDFSWTYTEKRGKDHEC